MSNLEFDQFETPKHESYHLRVRDAAMIGAASIGGVALLEAAPAIAQGAEAPAHEAEYLAPEGQRPFTLDAGKLTIFKSVETKSVETPQLKSKTNSSPFAEGQAMVNKCNKLGSVSVLSLGSAGNGKSKVKTRTGISGYTDHVNGQPKFNWKYRSGYKLCGKLAATYSDPYSQGGYKLINPTKNTPKSGTLMGKAKSAGKPITQLDVYVVKKK